MKHRIFSGQMKECTDAVKGTVKTVFQRYGAAFHAAGTHLQTACRGLMSFFQRLRANASAMLRALLKAVRTAAQRGVASLCSAAGRLRASRISERKHPASRRRGRAILRALYARRGEVAYYALLVLAVGALTWGAAEYRTRRSVSAPESDASFIEAASEMQQPAATDAPEEHAQGYRPVSGEILREFSPDELVWSEELGQWQTHPGVDFAGCAGEAVRAVLDGVVSQVYEDPLYGGTVLVDCGAHGTMRYSSLSALRMVQKGQRLAAGEILGAVGICPAEELMGEHLHLERYLDGEAVDPMEILAQ